MADNTFDSSINNGAPFPEFLKRGVSAAATAAPAPKGKINRFGHFLVDVAKSKNTHDFVIGAAISGGTSMAVRAGVFAAAATIGTTFVPTAIVAAAAAGAATGSVRYYLDYKKAKEAGTWQGFDKAEFFKKLMFSTGFSTLGGGMTYAIMNHGDVIMNYGMEKGGFIVEKLREAGVIDAATKAGEYIKTNSVAALEYLSPGATENLASLRDKAVATGGAAIAAVTNYNYGATFNSGIEAVKQAMQGVGNSGKAVIASVTNYDYGKTYNSSVETAKQTFMGWGASIKTALGFAPEPKAVVAEMPPLPERLPPVTSEQILAQGKDTVVVEAPAPVVDQKPVVTTVAEADPLEPRRVKTFVVHADATMISPAEQAAQAAARTVENARLAAMFDRVRFEAAIGTIPKAVNPDIAAYIPELGIYPQNSYRLPEIPRTALSFGTIYTAPDVSTEMTAAIETPKEVTPIENVVRPVPRPVTFADRFAKTFEDMDLSRRADRAFEAALNGTDQQKKDLAMNVLNGQGGFQKNPELAASIYKFLLEDTKPAAGEKPSQTHLQVVRDTAYLLFHGKGVAADPDAAKAMLQEIAPNSKVARGMLAEWNGEVVRQATASTSRAAVASVAETVTQNAAASASGLNCEFVSAGSRVVSGACEFKGDMPLRVGDRISLKP